MKFKYPYPLIFESDPVEMKKKGFSIGMLALTDQKELIIVSELANPAVWRSFWADASTTSIQNISIDLSSGYNMKSMTHFSEKIKQGFQYIIVNRYIFMGFLYWDSNVFDPQILEDWGLFKTKKIQRFQNMLETFQDIGNFPMVYEGNHIETEFLGLGERFFLFEDLSMVQIAQMTDIFKGSLNGVFGIPNNKRNIRFVLLSQNITKSKELGNLVLDKRGRETLFNWIKLDKFSAAGGFRIDYGKWALTNLDLWESLSLLPEFVQIIKDYRNYLSCIINKQEINFPQQKIEKIFLNHSLNLLKGLFGETQAVNSIPKKEIVPPQIQDQQLQPIMKIEKEESNIKKIIPLPSKLQKLEPIKLPSSHSELTTSADSTGYEDIFNKEKRTEQLFKEEGATVLDADKLDEVLQDATSLIENDLGDAINPSLMDEATIFSDLEASLAALSKLDDLAETDAAEMRLYYPPPTLTSYANEDGMEIGGSTCVLSMGVGRNIWTIPELRRMQMWGEFWRQEDIEGNPQIKDFITLENNKDINSAEQLEDILQKAFIRIRRNNQTFIGIAEFEGNGFETNVFLECDLSQEDLIELMNIHAERRAELEFPEISQESSIQLRYYGKPSIVQFLNNPKAQGALEIAKDAYENPLFRKGIITGVICLEEEAANFFILTDNFDEINEDEPTFPVDPEIVRKMFDRIKNRNLIPVSWCKMKFGFRGFDDIPLWDEMKEGIIMKIIIERYEKYLGSLVKSKYQEDAVRQRVEAEYDMIYKDEQTVRNVIKCAYCGTENSRFGTLCMACGKSLKEN